MHRFDGCAWYGIAQHDFSGLFLMLWDSLCIPAPEAVLREAAFV
jgi:hypothetical protein